MVTVTSIEWLYKNDLEAEVIISDGKYSILCFSHPCEYKIGDIIKNPLSTLFDEDVMRSQSQEDSLKKLNGYFAYEITANILDIEKKLVKIGEILIELNEIPVDLKNGDYITFSCSRLNLY